ncbi:Ribosomal protein S18 acetylase RimI [Roseovarius pacificus]|uniref:Ribosomal protein S18 acetylase RimI n=1 Tax=Roseovarius pacificus TaxID=337701 RepID=A0A1M6ZUN5_9RHOB|nr:GNAT family N-acetyltransferase [Roseovarius pacificus]GGO54207.1 N-acetyltransferase [Roseovarius pacificus]SHL34134.1 Ribosomal protein S18 acetylase RimI [Roseovarius pacificus]
MVNVRTIRRLSAADAPRLADLMTAYRRAMSGSEEAMTPEQATPLIERAVSEPDLLLLGADYGGALAGFALAFDLPEIISGSRAGQLDDLFVMPEARGSGLARALIGELTEIGTARGWTHLRWLVPQDNLTAKRLYLSIADPAPWDSFRIELSQRRSI